MEIESVKSRKTFVPKDGPSWESIIKDRQRATIPLSNIEDPVERNARLNSARLANIRTIKELAGKTMREMLRIKNCGRKSLDEFQELLRQYGLNFREET